MGYKLENKNIRINHFNLIGYGKTGNVYKYRKEALKIFPNGEVPSDVMDEESCNMMKKISTQAILLPRKTARFNDRFSGYSLKLVHKSSANGNIITMNKSSFLDSVSTLENDIDVLSYNGILLEGITPSNVLITDQIYITDPSRYSFVFKNHTNSDKLRDLNRYQLYLLLCEMITTGLKKSGVSSSKLRKVKEKFLEKDNDISCLEYFNELLENRDSFKSFVKKRS